MKAVEKLLRDLRLGTAASELKPSAKGEQRECESWLDNESAST